jgi:hypothetical protein
VPANPKTPAREAELVALLRSSAASLAAPESEAARRLVRYASELEDAATTERALMALYRFAADYKGAVPSQVMSGYGSWDCSVEFIVGRSYVFFVPESGRVSYCSGTQELSRHNPRD